MDIDNLISINEKYIKEDTVKVKMLIDITEELKKSDTKKALDYARQAITLSEKIQNDLWTGKTYYAISDIYFRTGDLTEAKLTCEKSKIIFEKGNNYNLLGTTIMRLGSIAARLSDFDKAIKDYEEALIIFDKSKNDAMKSKVTIGIATIYSDKGNYDKALEYFKKGKELNNAANDKYTMLSYYLNISSVYNKTGQYSLSIENCQKLISLAESMNEFSFLASGYTNLGIVYFELKDQKESLRCHTKALEYHQKMNNKSGIATAMVNLLNKRNEPKTAEEVENAVNETNIAIEYCKKVGNKRMQARAQSYLAYIYRNDKNFALAYFNAIEVLKIEKEIKNLQNIFLTNINLAALLLDCSDEDMALIELDPKSRFELAKQYLDKNLELAKDTRNREISLTWQHFSFMYEKQKDYPKAYDAYKQYISIKDSISGDDVKKQITRKEIQYEYDKKETALKYEQQLTNEQLAIQKLLTVQQQQELILSNKENELTQLAYLKEQAEKQEKTQQLALSEEREKTKEQDLTLKNLQLSAQQKQNLYMGAFIFLMLGGFGVLFYFYQTMRKQKNIISHQNQLNEQTISILSHDIKEPMMSVQFLLNKLNTDDPYIQRAKESINDQVASVNSIVSNLLQLKKTQNSEEEKVTNAIIYGTANKISQELNYKIVAKSLKFSNNTLHTEEVVLPISSQKLYITLLNLITNAIKHSPVNGTIELYTKPDGIYIRDHGTGIDPNIIDKIGRQHIDKTDTSGGSGMGLLLVSSMLADSKLKLKFENLQDGGTLAGVVINKN
ncbi:MAG: tetratricopeptide repeat protein [Saprospiraceae bacterium]|nr:tetratricopeptide repeat protein [Saprospiraceae bacterium]